MLRDPFDFLRELDGGGLAGGAEKGKDTPPSAGVGAAPLFSSNSSMVRAFRTLHGCGGAPPPPPPAAPKRGARPAPRPPAPPCAPAPGEGERGAFPSLEAPRTAGAQTCAGCGGELLRSISDLEQVCDGCGLVVEGDTAEPGDDGPRPAPSAARLRLVGPNSGQLQPDLYRSGAGTTTDAQTKQVFDEFVLYRTYYMEGGGRAFPLNVCQRAAEHYNFVQRECVKRSQNKKTIMAACLYYACAEVDFVPPKAEVAAFMQLPHKGIARGDNFVRSLVADNKMEVDVHADPTRAEVATLFVRLFGEASRGDEARPGVRRAGDRLAPLREAVRAVVDLTALHKIAVSSILSSKVAGATFVVLSRCRDRELVPRPPDLGEFCLKSTRRKNTVLRVVDEINGYHRFFAECYRAAGLDDAPPAPA